MGMGSGRWKEVEGKFAKCKFKGGTVIKEKRVSEWQRNKEEVQSNGNRLGVAVQNLFSYLLDTIMNEFCGTR